jgi:oligogalacturonide lyase
LAKGDCFPTEWHVYTDVQTNIAVRQLTNYKGHSHHLYFTNPGWYDDGRKLLFGSDRQNHTNLFGIDLDSGEITQLTDLHPLPPGTETSLLFSSKNPRREEVYFWHGRRLVALDLLSLAERVLYEAPAGFLTNMTSVTSDGRFLCTGIYEDLSGRFKLDLLHGYVGFREYFEARPLSRILRIDTETGRDEVVFEEHYWIGHVNTSPALPHLLTYCHEGPWHAVDHRIWGLDLSTGYSWQIRPGTPGERVGHEYWFADGERLGYHGFTAQGQPFFGSIRYDNNDCVEAPFPHGSTHFHSRDLNLIVGDGSPSQPYLLLWRFREGVFDEPRVALNHRGSFHVQITHVHPCFSPDGRRILFVSDATGYGNLHLIDIPDDDLLPLLSDLR